MIASWSLPRNLCQKVLLPCPGAIELYLSFYFSTFYKLPCPVVSLRHKLAGASFHLLSRPVGFSASLPKMSHWLLEIGPVGIFIPQELASAVLEHFFPVESCWLDIHQCTPVWVGSLLFHPQNQLTEVSLTPFLKHLARCFAQSGMFTSR